MNEAEIGPSEILQLKFDSVWNKNILGELVIEALPACGQIVLQQHLHGLSSRFSEERGSKFFQGEKMSQLWGIQCALCSFSLIENHDLLLEKR